MLIKVRVTLTAKDIETTLDSRTVINKESIEKDTIGKYSALCRYTKGKTWMKNNLTNWLLHKGKAREITLRDIKKTSNGKFVLLKSIDKTGSEVGPYFLKDLEEGKKVYFVVPGDELDYLTLEGIVRELNSEDRDWNRFSVKQMINFVEKRKEKRKEELREARFKIDFKSNFKYIMKSGGYQWVEILSSLGLVDEGKRMDHCLKDNRSYSIGLKEGISRIFSLRDMNFKNPKVTIEIDKDFGQWEVTQIQGKGNKPNREYARNVLGFLRYCNMKNIVIQPEKLELETWGIVQHKDNLSLTLDTSIRQQIRKEIEEKRKNKGVIRVGFPRSRRVA